MIYRLDEGVVGSRSGTYGAFSDYGPLAEDSAAKLKRSQLNVCTLFPPDAKICARLAGNYCQ